MQCPKLNNMQTAFHLTSHSCLQFRFLKTFRRENSFFLNLVDLTMEKRSVLFICLGNICRSPIAEAVFRNLIEDRGVAEEWNVDSAAIGDWHVGRQPEARALKVLKEKGINYRHAVRQVTTDDFAKFNFIFGMDNENISDLKNMQPKGSTASVGLLGAYDSEKELIIRDPYYDRGDAGFFKCYEQCVRSCNGFLDATCTSQ